MILAALILFAEIIEMRVAEMSTYDASTCYDTETGYIGNCSTMRAEPTPTAKPVPADFSWWRTEPHRQILGMSESGEIQVIRPELCADMLKTNDPGTSLWSHCALILYYEERLKGCVEKGAGN